MESKNVFDAIMDYIDDSVKLSYEEISRGIYEISGYTDLDFGKEGCISFLRNLLMIQVNR